MRFLTHHSLAKTGESFSPDDLLEEFLPVRTWENSIYTSDMDDTMFRGDSGQFSFIDCLRRPEFYDVGEADAFIDMLLPDTDIGTGYSARALIERGAGGFIPGMSDDDCRRALRMQETLGQHYRDIQLLLKKNQAQEAQEAIRLFLRDVLVFDALLISLNRQHPDQQTSSRMATAFSRVRLLKGQPMQHLANVAAQLLAPRGNADRHLILDVNTKRIIDCSVQVNGSILALLRNIAAQKAVGYVITGSPQPIAHALISQSSYAPIVPLERIEAVKLQQCEAGRLTGQIEGQHVFGLAKRRIIERLERDTGQRVRLALGDYPSSDRHMGAHALENNGVFVITQEEKHLERTRTEFDAALKEIMGTEAVEKAADRIWYVPAADA